jgi:hypothetical protein
MRNCNPVFNYLNGSVENVVEATYFANIRGECKTLPEVFADSARTWSFSWKIEEPTITLA